MGQWLYSLREDLAQNRLGLGQLCLRGPAVKIFHLSLFLSRSSCAHVKMRPSDLRHSHKLTQYVKQINRATHLEATLGFQLRLQPPSLEWRGKVQKLVPGDAGAWVML